MRLFNWISSLFKDDSIDITNDTNLMDASNNLFYDDNANIETSWDDNVINSANGLPMVGSMGGVDVEGNLYGTDFSQGNTFSHSIGDSFGCGNGFDDW